jgi:hypothetical protein
MAMREELAARVNSYNTRVKSTLASVNEIKAKVEYSKKEFDRGCAELSKELGREVNENNLDELYNELESNIEEQVRLGEQIMERANVQMNGGVAPSAGMGANGMGANGMGAPVSAGNGVGNNVVAGNNGVRNGVGNGVGNGVSPDFGFGAGVPVGSDPNGMVAPSSGGFQTIGGQEGLGGFPNFGGGLTI